jgi:hypothetical protein
MTIWIKPQSLQLSSIKIVQNHVIENHLCHSECFTVVVVFCTDWLRWWEMQIYQVTRWGECSSNAGHFSSASGCYNIRYVCPRVSLDGHVGGNNPWSSSLCWVNTLTKLSWGQWGGIYRGLSGTGDSFSFIQCWCRFCEYSFTQPPPSL